MMDPKRMWHEPGLVAIRRPLVDEHVLVTCKYVNQATSSPAYDDQGCDIMTAICEVCSVSSVS